MIWQARTGFSFRLAGGFFGVTPPGLPDPGLQAHLGTGAITGTSVADIKGFLASHRVGAVLLREQTGGHNQGQTNASHDALSKRAYIHLDTLCQFRRRGKCGEIKRTAA